MAYKALYRKYRPQTFSEVYGQDHIVETLKGELAGGKISHAYLFTGTRGTGKTSCAKILAKAVNCQQNSGGDPCLSCEACALISEEEATDIVELDAASNNGIDDVRILREQIAFSPTRLKYRVYIIDEVHMLSIQAFNALLKTLEEPPEHAIFILATTEVHKLPATILSRCQRFDFRRIEPEKITERINFIANAEGFNITPEAAALIAAAADGGMRDALSILDLCLSASKDITEETVAEVCGMSGNEYLNKLSEAVIAGDASAALSLIDDLYTGSVDMMRLAVDLAAHFRDIMVVKTVSSDKKPVVCSAAQLEIYKEKAQRFNIKDIMRAQELLSVCIASMQSANRRSLLEMTIIKLCRPELSSDIASLEKRVRDLELGTPKKVAAASAPAPVAEKPQPEKVEEKPQKAEKAAQPMPEPVPQDEEIPLPEEDEAPAPMEAPLTEEPSSAPADTPIAEWSEILKILSKTAPLMHGVLNGSKAYINGPYLLIDAPNTGFKSLVNGENPVHREAIRRAAEQVLGQTYKLGPYKPKSAEEDNDPLRAFANKLKQFNV
ncbi:MAG: DNA polymerase III subunit gamma/tau [Clostridia bacterium]|nr:DNA polymerase III subunit gamma/tau [Clostridia bacterium]